MLDQSFLIGLQGRLLSPWPILCHQRGYVGKFLREMDYLAEVSVHKKYDFIKPETMVGGLHRGEVEH